MFDTNGSRHLEAARAKVWPEAEWKPFKDDIPIRHLDVLSDEGRKLRIFDCTHESLDDAAITFLRLVVRKSTHKGITCCAIAVNKSKTDNALMDEIYAVYPLFMFARFHKGGRNSLEIASDYKEEIIRRSAVNYLAMLKGEAFELWWPDAFVGDQYVEYMRTTCQSCSKEMFAATGVIPLWLNAGSQVDVYAELRVHREGIHLRPLSACYDLLADGVPDAVKGSMSFGAISATPIRRDVLQQHGNFGYSAYCPTCGNGFDGDAFIEKVRIPFIRKPGRDIQERLKYVCILEKGINWDYDYVEVNKFDEELYREAGTPEPRWTLKQSVGT